MGDNGDRIPNFLFEQFIGDDVIAADVAVTKDRYFVRTVCHLLYLKHS